MVAEAEDLLKGDRRALARAITLVESTLERHREEAQTLLERILPHTGRSIRIGISGVPGVGKSTFIEGFGLLLVDRGHRVAVLAVDPSSPLRGGSILGDKTRMEELSRSQAAFIRPSPAGTTLGGVARATREAILLCEAAGHDVILVETVGTGQAEYAVAGMVDFFLVLMIPNAGDELQGIKRGIMELADALVINKADGESVGMARLARSQFQSALDLMHRTGGWTPRVLTCSARERTGLDEIREMIEAFRRDAEASGRLQDRRARQNVEWMKGLVFQEIQDRIRRHPGIRSAASELEQKVQDGKTTPHHGARRMVELLWATEERREHER